MTTSHNPYRGFRFPAEIIQHAVWLYHRFSLSLRDVELILAARGVVGMLRIRCWFMPIRPVAPCLPAAIAPEAAIRFRDQPALKGPSASLASMSL